MSRPTPAECSHTFASGRTAATGGHADLLRCEFCGVPMVWNGARYVPKATRT